MTPKVRWRVALALALGGGFFLMRDAIVRSLLYPAPPYAVPSPAPPPLEEVWFEGAEGRIHGWWSPAEGSAAALLLHGNGENLATLRLSGTLEGFRSLGVSLLAIDYPGYGLSEGRPSEGANIEAATLGLDWLKVRHPRPSLVGWSLGAAVAARVAAESSGELAGLALLSPWTRLREVAARHFPSWAVRALVTETYDTVSIVGELGCPVLVVHGGRDEIIPVTQGRTVADHAGARWVEVPSAGHNDLLASREAWMALGSFLGG